MKRMILVLAMLLLSAPAMADVVIGLVATETGFDVTYDASTEDGLVRAFALTLSISGGATMTAVTPATVGESTEGNLGYGIFPGSITIVGNAVTDDGTPAATSLPASTVIIEMGSLYVDGDVNAPGDSGVLCSVAVSGSGTVTVAEEPIRGGVVMEDPTEAPVVDVTASVVAPLAPACDGDFTGNGSVNIDDVMQMISFWNANKNMFGVVLSTNGNYEARYDLNGSDSVNIDDIMAMISYWNAHKNMFGLIACPGPGF